MPILKDEITKEYKKHCDFCGDFIFVVDKDYLKYCGWDNGTLKFSFFCLPCWQHYCNSGCRVGSVIKGYGRIDMETLNNAEQSSTSNKIKIGKKKVESTTVEWSKVDALIEAKTCKLKSLAESLGVSDLTYMRELLVTHYGERIEFKRGRAGGIFWKDPK